MSRESKHKQNVCLPPHDTKQNLLICKLWKIRRVGAMAIRQFVTLEDLLQAVCNVWFDLTIFALYLYLLYPLSTAPVEERIF